MCVFSGAIEGATLLVGPSTDLCRIANVFNIVSYSPLSDQYNGDGEHCINLMWMLPYNRTHGCPASRVTVNSSSLSDGPPVQYARYSRIFRQAVRFREVDIANLTVLKYYPRYTRRHYRYIFRRGVQRRSEA